MEEDEENMLGCSDGQNDPNINYPRKTINDL